MVSRKGDYGLRVYDFSIQSKLHTVDQDIKLIMATQWNVRAIEGPLSLGI